jgi:tRNA (guanine10-N2)-methyltransferase
MDYYYGSRSESSQRLITDSFAYLGFPGRVAMKNPEQEFCVFEEYEWEGKEPKRLWFGRLVGVGGRETISTYTLKKRRYISTTSLDSELALLTANLTCARPGTVFYDPFVGTGSLPIAASHYGACSMGSDIDGRSVRGKGGVNVKSSFGQYGLQGRYLDGFISDLTNSPLRSGRGGERGLCKEGGWLDGIVCDPPYGVREGLKVLGSRDGQGKEIVWIDGVQAHL